jgi:hypothetical protein
MPCDQVRITTLKAPAANVETMAEALRSLGYHAVVTRAGTIGVSRDSLRGEWAAGKLTLYGNIDTSAETSALAKAYAKQSIIETAKRQGWQLRFKADGDIEATRRRFA